MEIVILNSPAREGWWKFDSFEPSYGDALLAHGQVGSVAGFGRLYRIRNEGPEQTIWVDAEEFKLDAECEIERGVHGEYGR
jgi:hypothetical protein